MILYAVYILSNPSTGEVFYVGCTKQVLARYQQHTFLACSTQLRPCPKDKYIIAMGCNPIMSIVEVVKCSGGSYAYVGPIPVKAAQAEKKWIEHYKDKGAALVNQCMHNPKSIARELKREALTKEAVS